jgi:hypothetical protein
MWIETDPLKVGCLDWVEPAVREPVFDIMIDIESLGVTPGSVILNIGAVEFDPVSGQFGNDFYVALDIEESQRHCGCTIAASTIKWWMVQSEAARVASFGNDDSTSPAAALYMLHSFVKKRKVWSHGPAMDVVLLEWMYRKIGIEIPWKYGDVRCTRTIYDIAGVTINRSNGTHHNALDDAKAQALAVIAGYKKLALAA